MRRGIPSSARYNRTKVELKFLFAVITGEGSSSYNRTKVELKLRSDKLKFYQEESYNRTKVELKSDRGQWRWGAPRL